MIISLILCFGTPVIFYFIVRKWANKLIIPLIAGLLGFFVMQIIIRIPVLSILSMYTGLYEVNIFLLALILGSTAALFETFGRVVTVKFFLKDDHRFSAGLAHGIGHGGIEAILLVGITYINNLVLSMMINSGTFDELYSGNPSIYSVKEILLETESWMFLLGGVERFLTIVFHITLSVLVVYAFKIKKKYPVFIVLAVHAFLDFMVVILSHYGVSSLLIEVFIFICTGVMVYVAYKVYGKYIEIQDQEVEIIEEEGVLDV